MHSGPSRLRSRTRFPRRQTQKGPSRPLRTSSRPSSRRSSSRRPSRSRRRRSSSCSTASRARTCERALEALQGATTGPARGLQLVEIAGGLQIVTRTDLHEWVRRLFHERKTAKLSVQALETLAVVAYRQPVTAAEIAEIRGVNTSGVLAR